MSKQVENYYCRKIHKKIGSMQDSFGFICHEEEFLGE